MFISRRVGSLSSLERPYCARFQSGRSTLALHTTDRRTTRDIRNNCISTTLAEFRDVGLSSRYVHLFRNITAKYTGLCARNTVRKLQNASKLPYTWPTVSYDSRRRFTFEMSSSRSIKLKTTEMFSFSYIYCYYFLF